MPAESTDISIAGMTCASCVAHVGRALRKVPGVHDATVNLATERASIVHAPDVVVADLIAAVRHAGYQAAPVPSEIGDDDAGRRDAEIRRKRTLLILAAALFIPALVLGMAPVAFAGKQWVLFALTLPVWLVVGAEFHRGAFAALRRGTSSMDTLVSLGSTAAFGYSVYASIAGRPSYYETAGAIVTLVFAGKYLEALARGRSNRAIRSLLDLRPHVARVRESDGSVHEIDVEDVRLDQLLIVAAGERIPVDGIVEEGASAIDASMLTGEAIPVAIEAGDTVRQGTLNGDGTLLVRARGVGAGTTLAKIVELVRRAQGTTPPVQRLADRISSVFVPAILSLAALTFIGWLLTAHAWPTALSTAIAVLIVACPCALGLATPTAVIAGVGMGARRGLLFRDADAIERLGSARAVLFDKTGTLTLGKPRIAAIHAAPGSNAERVLAVAASLEVGSNHPLAAAIVHAARERAIPLLRATGANAQRGGGMQAALDGVAHYAGSAAYLTAHGIAAHPFAQTDLTRVLVADDRKTLGAIDLGDAARPESRAAVARLQRDGIDVQLVSGDADAPAGALAQQLGIASWYARITPQGKADAVHQARERFGTVAFVGDGINDAPALAAADVGIAMGAGSEIALETAHVAIVSNDPRAVATGIEISRATVRTIKQNLFWAFGYNVVLVPLAAFGVVHPILAAAAMGASSLFVVGNSLRLQRTRSLAQTSNA